MEKRIAAIAVAALALVPLVASAAAVTVPGSFTTDVIGTVTAWRDNAIVIMGMAFLTIMVIVRAFSSAKKS